MKGHKVNVRIIPTDRLESEVNTKKTFWSYISSRTTLESNFPDRLEYTFKKNFSRELKQDLINNFQDKLYNFERNYNFGFHSSLLDEYFHRTIRRSENDERGNFDDLVNSIAKLQEFKNNHFQENREYQELLIKNTLAAQIEFGIENITYSSLGFDLIIEPFDKATQLFDNNFELFRIFLDQYIPESFLSSLSIYDDTMPISVSIDYSPNFVSEFQKPTRVNKQVVQSNRNNNKGNSKWDKAKWAWLLTNTSLVVPVILALVVLYLIFNKFEIIEKNRQDAYKEINIERDKLLKSYQEFINLQKNSNQDLIKEIKTDTLK